VAPVAPVVAPVVVAPLPLLLLLLLRPLQRSWRP
jgi:hypothetical protein